MTPEERSLLRECAELARDNNKMLSGLRRGQLISRWLRIFYWVAIIALSIFGYFAIQPLIDQTKALINDTTSITGEIKEGTMQNFKTLLDTFQ